MLKIAGKAIDKISWSSNIVSSLLLLVIALSVFYEVFMRFVFGRPTHWVFSISLLLFGWFPFFALSYAVKTGRIISCDVFTSRASLYTREVLGIATDATSLIYIIALGYFGYFEFLDALHRGYLSSDTVRYPLWILRIVFPLGMLMCLLQTLRKIADRFSVIKHNAPGSEPKARIKSLSLSIVYLLNVIFGLWLLTVNMPIGILVMALTLLFWGVPIAFALGTVGCFSMFFFHGSLDGLFSIPIIAEKSVSHFVLVAVPLFVLGGVLLGESGLGERIYDLSTKWLSWLPGGLGVATCISGGILAAMIGSSTAVTAIITLVALNPLLARGYSKRMVLGTVTGSSLGLIIPPSVGLIVYGFLTDTSVGALFMAGFFPGSLLVILFSIFIIITCTVTGKYQKMHFTWTERFVSLKDSFLIILGPIFVLGSIYSGIATPTEAGAILVVYSIFCIILFRKMNLRSFVKCLMEASGIATMIITIMIGAITMSNVVTLLQVPMKMAELILETQVSNIIVITLLFIFYMVLGMFLDGAAITVLTVPVIAPMLPAIGIDTIAFGVILMILIEAALLTPPVGLNLFAVKGITGEPLSEIILSVVPFVTIIYFCAILVIIFPKIALWLPSALM